jgi:hypothetical protein
MDMTGSSKKLVTTNGVITQKPIIQKFHHDDNFKYDTRLLQQWKP